MDPTRKAILMLLQDLRARTEDVEQAALVNELLGELTPADEPQPEG